LRHEFEEIKTKFNTLNSDHSRLKNNVIAHDSKERQQRKKLDEANEQIAQYEERLRQANKQKVSLTEIISIFFIHFTIAMTIISLLLLFYLQLQSDLEAELQAEKQICLTKKRALQIATDELAKNQETIKQHSFLVDKMQNSIDWRTLVLLRMNDENKKNYDQQFMVNK
jgi:spindle assembly abnormal protein 6